MSSLLHQSSDFAFPPTVPVYRFTVEQYQKIIELGLVRDSENFELLEGLIVPKMARDARHEKAVERVVAKIRPVLASDWALRTHSAIITTNSIPEPDVAVVRGEAGGSRDRHPTAEDAGLIVEVGNNSIERDRVTKGRLFAHAHVPCYWILNLFDDRLEVYTEPTGPDADPRFRNRQDYRPSDYVPLVLDGKVIGQIPVSDLMA